MKQSHLPMPISSAICFYSTYKELKHVTKEDLLMLQERFYSTYKELKLSLDMKDKNRKARFYSTYKELKPAMGYIPT